MSTTIVPAIEVRKLTYKYPQSNEFALLGIDLTVSQGEFVAFIGQNGAGKTTLAKHFNGLHKPTSGVVQVMGKDVSRVSSEEIVRLVGYCYQNPDHQIFCRTVRDEVAYGPKNLGFSQAELTAAVEEALEVTELKDKAEQYPFSLGRGERQRLAIASVIAMRSPILVVDEPTTGLDIGGATKIMELLKRWNTLGRTILIITHDVSIVSSYVPRTVIMAHGNIIADGATRRVLADEDAVREAFVRPPQVLRIAQHLSKYGIPSDELTVDELYAHIVERLRPTRVQRGVV